MMNFDGSVGGWCVRISILANDTNTRDDIISITFRLVIFVVSLINVI